MNDLVVLKVVAGNAADFSRQTPNSDGTFGGVYAGTEAITLAVWPEGTEAAILTLVGPPNAWIDAAQTIWLVSLNDVQTGAMTPGVYDFKVTAPVDSVRTGVLFFGKLEVFASAGTTAPNNLASAYYVGKALTQIGLEPGEWEYLPDNIAAASDLIRKYCNRLFSAGTYVETLEVALDGYIRLAQVPVNQILRCQCSPAEALTVGNSTAASAWVSLATTGDAANFTGGPTVTGMTLNWEANGVVTTSTIAYATNMTIAALAAAINAVGNGWSATADQVLGARAVTEIMDGQGSKGASPTDLPEGAAIFHAYQSNVSPVPHTDDGAKTGLWYVGRIRQGGGAWGRWGPGLGGGDEGGSSQGGSGKVRVQYEGGFSVIPLAVQAATAELVKANFERLKTDAYLANEAGGSYSYALSETLIGNLPKAVRQTLSNYRVSNA